MLQTSFAERLQRIEMSQSMPVKEKLLAGISEELEREARGEKPTNARGSSSSFIGKPIRFVAGFVLTFACFLAVRRRSEIEHLLEANELLAPFMTIITSGMIVAGAFLALFFAFKLQRAVFRILSEPARLPFALGIVAGLALGLSPAEFTDTVMAQLQ